MSLYIGKNHGDASPVQSIFRLAGNDEDALTYALGYLLAYDQSFCAKLVRLLRIAPRLSLKHGYSVHLQEVTDSKFGRRDIVLETDGARIVLEAKIGGAEPTAEQLRKYADEDELWRRYQTRAVVALTRGGLGEATQKDVCSKLQGKKINFSVVQWHQIIDLVLGHRPDSTLAQYLFGEFDRYIRSDYDMGYHDAEILIQDVNDENAETYKEGWVYVTNPKKDKKAPLYFAPYFTKKAANYGNGILSFSRVMDTRVLVLAHTRDIGDTHVEPPSEVHCERWSKGLELLRNRKDAYRFLHSETRVFFLDRPISLLKPITKDAWNGTKNIPTQIPKGFSLRFDELLTGIVEPNG